MDEKEINWIVGVSGFKRSLLPFRYLGIPICSMRISAKDCMVLVEKMSARIKTWSTRNLSFVGRIVLINSVLIAIHSYWSQIMILPKKILREIACICHAFLWCNQTFFTGSGDVSWELICTPKKGRWAGFPKYFSSEKSSCHKICLGYRNKER